MPFPTATDLAFYQARNQPRWASRIARGLHAPSIDDVINAHAGVRMADTTTHNLLAFINGWSRRGDNIHDRLIDLANDDHRSATPNRKRVALAKKWAARIS